MFAETNINPSHMIQYKVVEKKFPMKGDTTVQEINFMAVPVRSKVVDARELGNRLCYSSSLTRADVMAVITGLFDEMRTALFDGDTLKLDNIGTFYISATNDKCSTSDELTPSKVKAKRICFRASDRLRRELRLAKFKRL